MANILIIDDQPFLAELLSDDLFEAENGEDALEQLRRNRPHIILLDLHIEGLERWDLLHRIKLEDAHLPVLIVTAYNKSVHDLSLAEADGYVIRDIYPDVLKKKIEDVLARHALNHES